MGSLIASQAKAKRPHTAGCTNNETPAGWLNLGIAHSQESTKSMSLQLIEPSKSGDSSKTMTKSTTKKPSLKERLKAHLAEYGRVAIFTYLALFVVTITGFAIAISAGIKTNSSGGTAGTLVAAWAATKLTQPIRIGATLALTPLLSAVITRIRGNPANAHGPADNLSEEE